MSILSGASVAKSDFLKFRISARLLRDEKVLSGKGISQILKERK
jgi:hypothetical protein